MAVIVTVPLLFICESVKIHVSLLDLLISLLSVKINNCLFQEVFQKGNHLNTNNSSPILASTRENLSSGFPSKRVSNRSPQLERVARKLKFQLK